MRRRILAVVTGSLILAGAAAPGVALAAPDNRPGGAITTPAAPTPDNGGDQGWGNCGHNSSAGNPHTGTQGNGGGNGGYHRGDVCAAPTDPGSGTGGGDTGGGTGGGLSDN